MVAKIVGEEPCINYCRRWSEIIIHKYLIDFWVILCVHKLVQYILLVYFNLTTFFGPREVSTPQVS